MPCLYPSFKCHSNYLHIYMIVRVMILKGRAYETYWGKYSMIFCKINSILFPTWSMFKAISIQLVKVDRIWLFFKRLVEIGFNFTQFIRNSDNLEGYQVTGMKHDKSFIQLCMTKKNNSKKIKKTGVQYAYFRYWTEPSLLQVPIWHN